MVQTVGAAWLMVSLGGSSQFVALVQTATSLPIVILALWAGALADSCDRRLIMLAAQYLIAFASLILALCAMQGLLNPSLLLGLTFLIGCGTALKIPAWQASVGEMVARPALPTAIAMNSVGYNIARSAGPAFGGVIVAASGAVGAFVANAVSSIGMIYVLTRWRPVQPRQALPSEGLFSGVITGLRFTAMSPNIRTVLIRGALFSASASAAPALMPLIARDLLGSGPLVYGLLLGVFGAGAVSGAFGRDRLRHRFSGEHLVRLAGLALAVGVGIATLSPWLWVTLFSLALAGAGWVLALSTFNVTVQVATPRWVLARALSIHQVAVFGGMAAGSAVLGALADQGGVKLALLVAVGGQAVSVLVGWILPVPDSDHLDLDPLDTFVEPGTAVSVQPSDGPVVIMLHYKIPEPNIPNFFRIMKERRRIRQRDGAQGWRLYRDLAGQNIWVERYHVATWLDYLRHNSRRTSEDRHSIEQLQTASAEPVLISRFLECRVDAAPVGVQNRSASDQTQPG
jgi:MFS family permease